MICSMLPASPVLQAAQCAMGALTIAKRCALCPVLVLSPTSLWCGNLGLLQADVDLSITPPSMLMVFKY